MADQIPLKVMKDGSNNTCGLAQFTSSDSVAIAAGGTGLTSQGICAFVQPGLYAVGCQVTYLGICAGKADTGVGYDNTYVGHSAGTAATTACRHTIIGSQAGKAITTCSGTVAIGYNAAVAQTFGDFNTYVGTAAGAAVTTASNNTVIGYHAATATICSNNIVIGTCAMVANTQGQDNVAIGLKAGATQVAAGCNNVFVGSCVGAVALCRDNTIVGAKAGIAQTTGVKNVFLGACVGYGVQGGSNNVYVGDQAGLVNTSGNANVFIGNCAGAASTASCCLIIGNGTCEIITGNFNTASLGINAPIYSTLTVGVNDTGYDVKFFGASSGAFMLYDESADTLDVRGATAAGPGVLKLTTGELTNVDGGILGRLEFQAPLDSAGTDAILVGASIWGEADATFSATVNTTDLVFATATSATATEKLRLTSAGVLKINNAYCMPSADGSAGYFLCTDGSGALAFAALTSSPWSTSGCFITVPVNCFVGIGTTAPQGLLEIAGTNVYAYFDASQHVSLFVDRGSTSYHSGVSFQTAGTANWRIGQLGADNLLQVWDEDAEAAVMSFLQGGNVGIGTTASSVTLTLNGTYSSNDDGPNIEFKGTATDAYPSMQILNYSHDDQSVNFDAYYDGTWKSSDAGSNFSIRKASDTLALRYDTGISAGSAVTWNDGFIMDGSGNIGIGTTAPSSYLDLWSSANVVMLDIRAAAAGGAADLANGIRLFSNVGGASGQLAYFQGTNGIHLTYGHTCTSVNGIVVSSHLGHIGIGTAAPDGLLHVFGGDSGGTAHADADDLILENSGDVGATFLSGSSSRTLFYFGDSASATANRFVWNQNLCTFSLWTASTQRWTLDNSGKIFIGKTSSALATAGWEIAPSGAAQMTQGTEVLQMSRTASDGDVIQFYRTTSSVGGISVNASNTAFNTSSDYRLKENIVDLTGAVNRVAQLQPHRFNFIVDADTTVDGFVAHEVSDIVPEAITGTKDGTKSLSGAIVDASGGVIARDQTEETWVSGKEPPLISEATDEAEAVYGDPAYAADTVWHETLTVPDYQGIDQAKLVPLLTAAIQELTARVAALESA